MRARSPILQDTLMQPRTAVDKVVAGFLPVLRRVLLLKGEQCPVWLFLLPDLWLFHSCKFLKVHR